jgi:hypothetical protein
MRPNEKTLFKEEQQFRQYWLWAIMAMAFLFSTGIIIMVARSEEASSNEAYIAAFILLPVFALTFYLMYISKLETLVTEKGIYFRWAPYFRKYNFISHAEIEKAEERKSPFGQYGFHLIPTYGRVHNVHGRQGVQLYLKNGKKIYLGSQDVIMLKKAVDRVISKQIQS